MSAPRAVKKQVEEAEEMMKSLMSESSDQNEEEERQHETQAGAPEATGAGEQASARDSTPGSAADDGVQPSTPDFEHKYNVLKGKYDKEVPALHSQLRDMQARQSQLEALIANMRSPKEDSQPERSQQPAFEPVTSEEIEEYGEDLVNLIRRAASEVVDSALRPVRTQLQTVNQQVGGVTQVVSETKRDKVYAKLDKTVENWRDINRSEEFIEWLNDVDPYAGVQRGVMLRKAFDSGEADRVAAFFTGYLNEHAAVSSSQPEAPKKGTPPVDANKLVAPGKTRANKVSAGAQDDKRVYTEQEINDFYKAVSRGEFRKDPKEKDRIERDIFRALNEGRVVPANRVPVSNAAY